MAETTTKIFTVDTGKAITNLKEYKAYLDELKGALLGLEQGTDEYNKTAKALREGQQKLNDVIDVAKGKNTAAADSYDALNKKLVELRRTYRTLSEENRDGIVGAKMLEEIKNLDTKLKGLDADMGQYFRNVGDYKNAFADAFDKMLGPMGKVGGVFGNLARDVKGMIPLIKSVNASALTGLKGIRAAIASTGIGLLIVAVGELAANWENVCKWVEENIDATGRLEQKIKEAALAQKQFNEQVFASLKKDTDEYNRMLAALRGENLVLYDLQKRREDLTEIHQKASKAEGEAWNRLQEATKNYKKEVENSQYTYEDAERKAVKRAKAVMDAAQAEYDKQHEVTQAAAQDVATVGRTYLVTMGKMASEGANKTDKIASGVKKISTELDALQKSAESALKTLYESELNPFEKLENSIQETKNLLQKADAAGVIDHEDYLYAIEILDKQYAEGVSALMKETADEIKEQQIKEAQDGTDKAIAEIERKLKKAQITAKIKIDTGEKTENGGFKDFFKSLFSNEEIDKWLDEQTERINKLYDPQIAASEEKIKAYDDEIAKLKELGAAQEEIDAVEADRRNEELEYLNLKTEKQIENNEAINESEEKLADLRQKRINVMAQGVEAVGNLMNNLASMMTNQIQQEVKEGKISESEAKKKFKTIKAMQYASAVMTTAAGVAAALAGVFTTKSGPWDYVLAGIQAASIAAGGAIQIATIARQKFDTSGGGNSITTPDLATVTNEYKPEYVQNIQTQSELSELSNAMGQISPVVTVSDIEDGLQTSKVRVEENSF